MDNLLKQLFPKIYYCCKKRGRNVHELLTRADPSNIKNDLLDLNVHGYKTCGKKCNSCNNFVDETSFVISKATGGKYWIRRDTTCTTEMLHLWFLAQNVGNKGRVLLCLGNLAYQVIKVTLNNLSVPAK